MDVFTTIILLGIGLFTAVILTVWSFRRYEVAVFLVGLSPWLSSLFIPLNSDGIPEATLGSYLRIGLLIWMGGVGCVQYIRSRSSNHENLPLHFILFGVFLLLALISISYSIDPFYSIVRSCAFIALFGFLIGLHAWLRNGQRFAGVLHTLFLLVAFFILTDALSLVIFSGRVWGEGINRFQGLWSHPNTLGSVCMVSYPVLLWEYTKGAPFKRFIVVFLFVGLACLHLLTGSRASMAAACLGLCVWLLIQKKRRSLILAFGLIGVVAFSIGHFKPSSFHREEGTGLADLTGRQDFWHGSLILLKERPLLGYGYGVEGKIWEDPRFYGSNETLWSGSVKVSLHNGYFSIAIGLGLISFFIWCLILFLPLWRAWHMSRSAPLSPSFEGRDGKGRSGTILGRLRLSSRIAKGMTLKDFKALAITLLIMGMTLNFFEGAITEGRSFVAIMFWIAWVFAGRLPPAYSERIH